MLSLHRGGAWRNRPLTTGASLLLVVFQALALQVYRQCKHQWVQAVLVHSTRSLQLGVKRPMKGMYSILARPVCGNTCQACRAILPSRVPLSHSPSLLCRCPKGGSLERSRSFCRLGQWPVRRGGDSSKQPTNLPPNSNGSTPTTITTTGVKDKKMTNRLLPPDIKYFIVSFVNIS